MSQDRATSCQAISDVLGVIENYLQESKATTPDWLIINDRRLLRQRSYHKDPDKTRASAYALRADSYTDAALLLWQYLQPQAKTQLRDGIESLKNGAKPTTLGQLNAHISLLADLLTKAIDNKQYNKAKLFRYLLDAEQLVCWRQGRKALVTISDCPNPADATEQFTLLQVDWPRASWTQQQQQEFRRCQSPNQDNWPVWFRALDGWEQAYWQAFLTDHPGDLNAVLSSPPCTRRRYPGLANYLWHSLVIYKTGEYKENQRLFELTRARSSIIYPIDINEQKEAQRIAADNVQQLRADHGVTAAQQERCLLLQTLVTPAVIAKRQVYEGFMREEKRKVADGVGAIETNYSLNQTWFHPADRFGTGKFSSKENYSPAIIKLIATVTDYLQSIPSSAQTLINLLQELEQNFSHDRLLHTRVKQASITGLLPRKRANELYQQNDSECNYQRWFTLLSCLKEYLSLHRRNAIKQEKWYSLLLPALEEIIIACLDDAIAHASCKSGKDRRAMLLLLEDSLLCLGVMTADGFNSVDDVEKNWLAVIYAHLFTTGHHQCLAAHNATGCYGLKSVSDMLPSFILSRLKLIDGLLAHNKACSQINRPNEVARRHYREQYLKIIKQYVEGKISVNVAQGSLLKLRQQTTNIVSTGKDKKPLSKASVAHEPMETLIASALNDVETTLDQVERQGIVPISQALSAVNDNNDGKKEKKNDDELESPGAAAYALAQQHQAQGNPDIAEHLFEQSRSLGYQPIVPPEDAQADESATSSSTSKQDSTTTSSNSSSSTVIQSPITSRNNLKQQALTQTAAVAQPELSVDDDTSVASTTNSGDKAKRKEKTESTTTSSNSSSTTTTQLPIISRNVLEQQVLTQTAVVAQPELSVDDDTSVASTTNSDDKAKRKEKTVSTTTSSNSSPTTTTQLPIISRNDLEQMSLTQTAAVVQPVLSVTDNNDEQPEQPHLLQANITVPPDSVKSAKKSSTDFDYLVKLLLVGDTSAEKSRLLIRFADDTYTENPVSTIGGDFKIKTIEIDDKIVKLQIWVTTGQEKFRTITSAYYRGAMGIMLVYNPTDSKSFYNITQNYLPEIKLHTGGNGSLVLVGNSNEDENKVITTEEASAFANKQGIPFIEVSARSGHNVDQAFFTLARAVLVKSPIVATADPNDEVKDNKKTKSANLIVRLGKSLSSAFRSTSQSSKQTTNDSGHDADDNNRQP